MPSSSSTYSQYLLQQKQKKGFLFIPYIAVGDGGFDTSYDVIATLLKNGADSIELGLPFTDPSADGEVLQRAFERILKNDFTLEKFFTVLEKLHKNFPEKQFAVMGYANIFFKNDFAEFCKKLARYNVKALIIPDLPLDEQQLLVERLNLRGLENPPEFINFVTPTTEKLRLQRIAEASQGFIYAVSLKGVTGVRTNFSLDALKPQLKELRNRTKIPLMIGFGISRPEHIASAIEVADGVIVGSLFHSIIEENLGNKKKIPDLILQKAKELLNVKIKK